MPVNSRHELLRFPKSYAFVIGVDHYPKLNADLQSAVRDAREVARVLRQRQGFDHVELVIEPLPGVDRAALESGLDGVKVHFGADGAALRELLLRIQHAEQEPHIQPKDCLVFYYAGHGKPGAFDEGPAGYLLPTDARPERAMLKNDSLLPMEDVFSALQTLDCHHTLLILDCCFAGKFRLVNQNTRDAGWATDLPMYPERFERFARERAWQVLVSSGPHQTAADWVGERAEVGPSRHSPFAGALIEALDGRVRIDQRIHDRRRGDGVLTAQELFLHLWDRVERLTNDGNFDQDIQYPDLFPMGKHHGGQFIFFDPDNKLNLPQRQLRNPYRGLQPFEPEHSDLFFGREDVVRTLLQKIQQTDLLVISAPSGGGKSSLVRAGLYPQLLKWTDDTGRQSWSAAKLFVLRPGAKPWQGSPVYDRLEAPRRLLHYTGLRELLPQLTTDQPQVLLIDQYEELFTAGADPAEVATFETELARLHESAAQQRLKVLITLRSDYEWQLQQSTFGAELLAKRSRIDWLYRVPPMNLDDLHRALVLPAEAELYDFETEELPQRILAEIGYAPGALPLLSFTMSRFYEITDKDTRVFTRSGYRKLGGVNAALSAYADGVYQELGKESKDHQDVMRKLFLRMVKVTEGGYDRRRVYVKPGPRFSGPTSETFLNEFDYADQHDTIVNEVIDRLVKRQLLMGDSDYVGAYLEPVHTALIQHWAQGKQWIADFGAEQLELQRELWRAVMDSKRQRSPAPGNFYGADADDGVVRDPSLTDDFSELWESNAKLITVIRHITAAAKDFLLTEKQAIIDVALPHIAPEDHAKFIAFWDDCYDKEVVPDLNSLVLSGYSDKLLQLCLEKGDHWLNQAESQFVRQSWDKRIADVLEMKRQRDEARQAQERTVNELIEASWKTGVYLDPEKQSIDDQGYERLGGVRDLYARLKLLMSLDKAQSISPVPIFVRGPHREDFTEDGKTFGYYNPEFLAWAKSRVIPASRKPLLRRLTQPFFDAFLRDMARTYYLTYQYLDDHAEVRDHVQAEYLAFVESGALLRDDVEPFSKESSGGLFLESYFEAYPWENKEYFEAFLGDIAYFNWVVSCGFWIRRRIDTTASAFKEILDELLQTYDADWLANPPELPDSARG